MVKIPFDIMYEISQHLNLENLLQLCKLNPETARFCRQPNMLEIIRRKVKERNVVSQMYNEILLGSMYYDVQKRNHGLATHTLKISPKLIDENIYIIKNEQERMDKSILLNLFSDELVEHAYASFWINDPTEQQIKTLLYQLIKRPDFDEKRIMYYDF